jgi:tRNA-splicing ligase RtcB (3'-phosphate/5'-hydroxy nucleic acid ligase)
LRSFLKADEVKGKIRSLVEAMFATIPTGVGTKGRIALSPKDQQDVVVKGVRWAVDKGYGEEDDLTYIEDNGCIEGADPDKISQKAYKRGERQLGTLGSGNHFLEIQFVEEIYDDAAAKAFGLEKDQVTVMIHTGSRGFGHQVCTDYLVILEKAVRKYGIHVPDRQLACAPINTKEAGDYLAAMRGAANYAFTNRHCLMHWTKDVFQRVLRIGPRELGMSLVYDVAHNIVKIEKHKIDGKTFRLAVHRKGATRAFAPGRPEIPRDYQSVGQPVLIPGDMGRCSYVLAGTEKAMDETFGSTCHGAGRLLSRHAAKRLAKGRAINRELESRGIFVKSSGATTLKEEMSEAYKDISDVVHVVDSSGISKKVVKLKPLGNIKG